METEEEQESLRREAREHQLEDDTEIETETLTVAAIQLMMRRLEIFVR